MLEYDLLTTTAQAVRFAVSPAQELFSALQATLVGRAGDHLRRWSASVSATVAALGVSELLATLSGIEYAPDFLTPPPRTRRTTVAKQLDEARRVDPKQVADELELAFAGRRRPKGLPVDPLAARDLLIDQFARCWRPVLADPWRLVAAILDADIALRADQYASDGLGKLLCDLHPSVQVSENVLRISAHHPRSIQQLDNRGLLLIPSVFSNNVGPVLIGFWQPALGLFRSRRRRPPAPACLVAGRTRSTIFTALAEPATTSALSVLLGVAPSTVSEHLQALQASGLCDGHRLGRTVQYRLTPRGKLVLEAFVSET